jgi:hypothetical protein
MTTEKEKMRAWVENWKVVGPMLEQIVAEEMRMPEYADRLKTFGPFLNWCSERAVPRTTSGLVEQQEWFMKLRHETKK